MKISQSEVETEFKDIKPGEVFKSLGAFYMRTYGSFEYNAVRLLDGNANC